MESTEQDIRNILEIAQKGVQKVCIWGVGNVGTNFGFQLLKELEIKVDFFYDNNKEVWNKEIIEGIRCISLLELQEKKPICFLLVSSLLQEEIYIQAKELGLKTIVTYYDLCKIKAKSYFSFKQNKRIAIYTCIVNDYDKVLEPLSFSNECDYYVISDKKIQEKSHFNFISVRDYLPPSVHDYTKINRYFKINPHKIFDQYKYSIYFDGNIRLRKGIENSINELPKTRITALGINIVECLYIEAMRAIEQGRDNKEIIMRQVERYWLEGMPEMFGSVFCGILVREHHNPVCKKIMEDWWDEVEHYSRRDMISFPYSIWKNGFTMDDVNTLNHKKSIESELWKIEKSHTRPREALSAKRSDIEEVYFE